MKEYVFKIVAENGICRVELPEITLNNEYEVPDVMAALTREFLDSMSRDAVLDGDSFMADAIADLKALQAVKNLRDAAEKVN
ncbi:hypothetical protein [Neisseria sp. HMSC064E01]|jgi:hypothetical protein|uniref:hypothetical protein n=1 Tax=Neisseria sp. HMSC064E01 TaxID=1715052 RepID=UPI0008A326F5|nr:hypothetical protein [Neisseria sp. HMSC064E01]OFN82854.1 hypothetical protein HMPREF2572_03920 [Neisseria sp. HMSC064E01]DAK54222.1 MAG TPA: hypothetical protein [Caudoviricetes sp.]